MLQMTFPNASIVNGREAKGNKLKKFERLSIGKLASRVGT
jgi:hypothetical protein